MNINQTTHETDNLIRVDLLIPQVGEMLAGDLGAILCGRGLTVRTTKVAQMTSHPAVSSSSFVESSMRDKLDEFAVVAKKTPFVQTHSNMWTRAELLQRFSRINGHISCIDEAGTFHFQVVEGIKNHIRYDM